MKYIALIFIIFLCSCETSLTEINEIKKPAVIVDKQVHSVVIKDRDGEFMKFTNWTHSGSFILRNYERGDTIR